MKRIAIALLCSGLLTLTSCGNEDDEKGPEALTEAEFVKQANAVCAASTKQFRKVIKRERIDTAAETVAFLGGTGHDLLEQTYEGIAALVPPQELEADVEAMLDAAEKSLDRLEQNPRAAIRSGDLFDAANAKATALGLKKCD